MKPISQESSGARPGRVRIRVPGLSWPVGLLLLACALIVTMAALSRFNVHPDEDLHTLTANYYRHHWFPPAMDDPELVPFLHPLYGVSYLMASPPDIVYLLAAKTAGRFESHGSLGHTLRWFNVSLFLILVLLLAWWRVPSVEAYALGLLLTPQLWYIFSYFNGDALPFFLAFLVVIQLGYEGSPARRFLDSDHHQSGLWGGLLLGVPFGLLLLAKQNYYVFVGFGVSYAAWHIFSKPRHQWSAALWRWMLVGTVALLVAGPVVAYDGVINDFSKAEKRQRLVEKYAHDAFKPSQVSSPGSFPGMRLKARGERFVTLVWNRDWLSPSFKSFVGVYGYMSILSPTPYYYAQAVFWMVFVTLAGFWLSRHLSRRGLLIVISGICFSAMTILQSLYHSWVYDFQAQGRYLFPAIPILLLTWLSVVPPDRSRLTTWLGVIAFLLGAYSFLAVGLAQVPK